MDRVSVCAQQASARRVLQRAAYGKSRRDRFLRYIGGAAGARFRKHHRGRDCRDFSRGYSARPAVPGDCRQAGARMLNVSVGLIEGRAAVDAELTGTFTDLSGRLYPPGRYRFDGEATLTPSDMSACAFALDDVTIGIGFHWERRERQVYRGALRLIRRGAGLTAINDIPLEEYVTSVISSEMSASCPLELLKAHAVISRSWLWFPKAHPAPAGRTLTG